MVNGVFPEKREAEQPVTPLLLTALLERRRSIKHFTKQPFSLLYFIFLVR